MSSRDRFKWVIWLSELNGTDTRRCRGTSSGNFCERDGARANAASSSVGVVGEGSSVEGAEGEDSFESARSEEALLSLETTEGRVLERFLSTGFGDNGVLGPVDEDPLPKEALKSSEDTNSDKF